MNPAASSNFAARVTKAVHRLSHGVIAFARRIQPSRWRRQALEFAAAHDQLRRSEEQFQSLIASMGDLVFSIDLSDRLLIYHPMPTNVSDTPFDADVFVGKPYREVLPAELTAKLGEAVSAAMSTLTTQQIDYSAADGERFYSARISPMIGADLQLLGVTVVVSDVTEAVNARQQAQAALIEARDAALRSAKLKSDFVSNMSHELRTPMNREIVIQALEQFGYAVDIARNGEEVLSLLDQRDYRLILMDMQMPVMDGLEATRRIRALGAAKKDTPIIAFTASIERAQRREYLDSGINAIIGKPFTLRELRQTIETWLRS